MTDLLPAQVMTSSEMSKRIEEQTKTVESLLKIISDQQAQIENIRSVMLNQAKQLDESFATINKRIDNLEGKPTSELRSSAGDWRSLDRWRKLKIGMSEKAVRDLLGEPERISGGTFTRWYYMNLEPPLMATVVIYEGKLESFEEPRSMPKPN
jgi:hypothetical protein